VSANSDELGAVLPLKPNDYHILFALLDGERHGYWIAKEIRRQTVGQIHLEAGNLHRTIQKLIRQGLVEPTEKRPAPESDDERRRYYTITPLGRQAVAADAARMKDLVEAAQARNIIAVRKPG
jgi:DNA-binding PadR family transcriptional regulator